MAQLRLAVVPARPCSSNQSVVRPHPQLAPGCNVARSPMTTACAGLDEMYGETNSSKPRWPYGWTVKSDGLRTKTFE